MSKLTVDLDMVRKYNTSGPRYTSYPPATHFKEGVSWPTLAQEILENNKTERGLSLYFHLPFCQSLCWYCGCTTVITTDQKQSNTYLSYLEKEMRQLSTMINPKRLVKQLHFGGGTPTFLSPAELRQLGDMIQKYFRFDPNIEAGVEIDPRRLTRAHLEALRAAGFNRASLGVQDFDPKVQVAVHRIQPREQTERVIGWIRDTGFTSLNIDLIYGLPHQTVASFDKTLDTVLQLRPDRLAIFSYAHVPWVKPAQKILETEHLPSPDVKLGILKQTIERLTGGDDYVYIGMDHFSLKNDELAVAQRNRTLQRNFQGYSTKAGTDIYAFGMSSISQTETAYWQNEKELPKYYATLDAGQMPITKAYIITEDDRIRREVIMQLMCNMGLSFGAISDRFGIDFIDYFSPELTGLAPMINDGLLFIHGKGLEITQTGRLFIRNIAMQFDAHLRQETTRRYCKTI